MVLFWRISLFFKLSEPKVDLAATAEDAQPRVLLYVHMSPFEATYPVSFCPGLMLGIDFSSPIKDSSAPFIPASVCWPVFHLKPSTVTKGLSGCVSEKPRSRIQLGSACSSHWPDCEVLAQTKKSRFSSSDLFFLVLCVFARLDAFTSRWWAWTLIKGLSPEEALQVRAKVASLEALKGQRTDLGLQRAWEGNYLVSMRDGSVRGRSSAIYRKLNTADKIS